MSERKLDDPALWVLLEDGERLVGLDGTVGPYKERSGVITSVEGGYHNLGRIVDNLAFSWTGSNIVGRRDGNLSLTPTGSKPLYRRDGDVITDIGGRVVARIEKEKK